MNELKSIAPGLSPGQLILAHSLFYNPFFFCMRFIIKMTKFVRLKLVIWKHCMKLSKTAA
jgi:hypothetical protein